MHRYFPHTQADIEQMLQRCGVEKLSDLYADIPEQLLLKNPYNVDAQMSEQQVRRYFADLARMNTPLACFAGAGFYDHYTPSIVNSLISRSEFLTAYTPYQPEISQGTLQYIFEYQSMMASLTSMEVSNASMYDGATATAEAVMMAVAAARRRNRVLVSATLNPTVTDVVRTYAHYHGIQIDTIPQTEQGTTDFSTLDQTLAQGDVAAIVVATPNFYGIVEDYEGIANRCHQMKTLMIVNCIPSTLGVLRTPGQWGADIACGDAQSLGMPLNFGGPYLGFICCTKALMRKLPGRIVGATTDKTGQRSFVLTLQAREQHIRRDKATSNICSNQGLMALFVDIYLSTMGPSGLRQVSELGASAAHYLADQIIATGKAALLYPGSPWLNEFAIKCNFSIDYFMARCTEAGLLPGVKIADDTLLVAATETITRSHIEKYIEILTQMPTR